MTIIEDPTIRKKTDIFQWDLKNSFNISRGSKTSITTILLTIDSPLYGFAQSEAVPYGHYGESASSVISEISNFDLNFSLTTNEIYRKYIKGLGLEDPDEILEYLKNEPNYVSWEVVQSIPTLYQIRKRLNKLMKPGAARNALDCALWQLESGKNYDLPLALPSSYTIVLNTPNKMIADAIKNKHYPTVKIKVDHKNLDQIIPKIREICPKAKIILDANESFNFEILRDNMEIFVKSKVDLIEQPLPADNDYMLEYYDSPIPICADESFHSYSDFKSIKNKYSAINIKLDKTGGLTEALKIAKKAKKENILIMLGCMVCSSLSIWPVLRLHKYADFIDLDGPSFLMDESRRRWPLIKYENGMMILDEYHKYILGH